MINNDDYQPEMIAFSKSLTQLNCGWSVKGNYHKGFQSKDFNLTHREIFVNSASNFFIEKISLLGYLNRKTTISIELKKKYASKKDDIEKILNLSPDYFSSSVLSINTKSNSDKILKYFYDQGQIPDLIIDRIVHLQEFDIDDFRINGQKIIQLFEQNFIRDNNKDEIELSHPILKTFIIDNLTKIKDEQQRQQACWDITKYLKNNVENAQDLVIELCYLIVDQTLPFYCEARLQIAEHKFAQPRAVNATITDHYREPFIETLKAADKDHHPELLNILTKNFINDDEPGGELPESLANMTTSHETVVKLLNIIREQNIEIKKLSTRCVEEKSTTFKIRDVIIQP